MNIRTSFQFVVFLIPVLLVGSIGVIGALVIIPEYSQVESTRVQEEMAHVENLLDYMLNSIDTMNWDWASWDDMYNFVEDETPSFIESNYVNGTFIDSEINIIVLTDISGDIVFSKYIDLNTEEILPIPDYLIDQITDNEMVNSSGFLVFDDLLLMFSSRHVLTSKDEGPSRGSHFMARVMDDDLTDTLSYLSHNDVKLMLSEEPQEMGVIINNINDTHLSATKLIEDVTETNRLSLFLTYNRVMFVKGTNSLWSLLIYLGLFGIVFIGITHYLTDKLVLNRLSSLSTNLEKMVEKTDFRKRLPDEGTDEIGIVSSNVNTLLGTIEEVREKELSQRDRIEEIRKNHYSDLIDNVKSLTNLLSYDVIKPLNAIKSVAHVLRNEKNIELAVIIEDNIKITEKTLSELSILTNLSKLRRTLTDVNEVIDSAIQDVQIPNNITVKIQSSDAFIVQDLDGAKMIRVFENIIKNAVESMPGGGVLTVTVSGSEKEVAVCIYDTGIGMSESEMEGLFRPFYTNKSDGIGFGLVYAKQVVEAHFGSINIMSEVGKGTSVSVVIPYFSTSE